MHGRIKVKTTAEQQEAKRKEREKKAKIYTAATNKVFEKRANQEYDKEALEITGQILGASPDFYTLWNYRKEILLQFKEKMAEDEFQTCCRGELSFLETCLRVNPKSYGSWEHRCFVLDTMPNPDWNMELELCNTYLEYDERNFHCWDYRRFVVKRSEVTPQAEFDFTTNKISSNFSNYSSWHYRSKLLPLLHPDVNHPVGVKEKVLLQEFELAQNAFFTDPNDQSAWFYHRWLLGRAERPLSVECVHLSRELNRVMVRFTKPILIDTDASVSVTQNGKPIPGTWRTPSETRKYSHIWLYDLTDPGFEPGISYDINVTIDSYARKSRACTLHGNQTESVTMETCKQGTMFSFELSAATNTVLTQELESCLQLYELEPDNKWVLLTIVLLMRAIDPLQYETETIQHIDSLIKSDPCRTRYYNDMKSKFVIENAIELQSADDTFDVANRGLTMLSHMEQLATKTSINLSQNALTSLSDCDMLQCVRVLDVSGNKLSSCRELATLPLLEELNIQSNDLASHDVLIPLKHCSRLKVLNLAGNPLCKDDAKIKDLLMNIQKTILE